MKTKQNNITVTCPTRIDFTGGFTDVMPFRATQWVSHVNLAINLPVEVVVETGSNHGITLKDNSNQTSITYTSVDEIDQRFPLIGAALRHLEINNSITIRINSHAPHGAGLGTSGALSVALVTALMLFKGQALPVDNSEIAMVASEIELMSGTLGGLQDQFASATGGLNLFQFYGTEHSIKRVSLSDQLKREIEKYVLILYPGGSRSSSDIVTKIMDEYSKGNTIVGRALLSLNELAIEIMKSLKRAEWTKLSSLLRDVREQQVILHPDIIDKKNLQIINNLSKLGIEGTKLLGGGGCGTCLLAVSRNSGSRKIIKNFCDVQNVGILPVKCASKGIQVKINKATPVI